VGDGYGYVSRALTLREATDFASMVLSGAPVAEVVPYFCPDTASEDELLQAEETWPMQAEVLAAIERQSGGVPWHQLGDDQRLDVALRKHYNEMAYFLWTTNYAACDGASKLKADTCRSAIEAKVAGMAGQESPLASFYHDLLRRYEAEPTKVQ
jgi:hypothetical protein